METTATAREKSPARLARERLGITQFELAVRSKLSLATVSLAERGAITEATAKKLAKALGVEPAELLR
jgi:transcriptional regulator with XRE-family HTH domain